MEKILGLDLGTTTLGVAMTDSLGIAAHGVETFRFEPGNFKAARERANEIANKEGITKIALGMPLYESGDLSPHAKSCLRFRDDLMKLNSNIKLETDDEKREFEEWKLIHEIKLPVLEKRIWYLPQHKIWVSSGCKLDKYTYSSTKQLIIEILISKQKYYHPGFCSRAEFFVISDCGIG